MKRHQNTKCLNCGRIWEGIVDRAFLDLMFLLGIIQIEAQNSGLCKRCRKGWHWTNKCRSKETNKATHYHRETPWEGLTQTPKSKVVWSFPVTVEDTPFKKNKKTQNLFFFLDAALDDSQTMYDKPKILIQNRKLIFLTDFYKWQKTKAENMNKEHYNGRIIRHRCRYDYCYSRILASELATLGGRHSIP